MPSWGTCSPQALVTALWVDYGRSKVKWTRERAQGGTGLGMSSPLRFFFAPPPSRPPVDTQPAAFFCSASQSTPSRCPACCASFLLRLPVDSQSTSTLLRGAPGSNSACGKPPKVPGDTPLGQPCGSVSPAAPLGKAYSLGFFPN